MIGQDGGDEGPDDGFFKAGEDNIGATIMGRSMFGPIRARGTTTNGPAGGATSRPTTTRSSC
jgi:hypothetical protein